MIQSASECVQDIMIDFDARVPAGVDCMVSRDAGRPVFWVASEWSALSGSALHSADLASRLTGCIVAALLTFALCSPAFAAIPSDELLHSLKPVGDVNDFAGILSPADKSALEQRTREMRDKTGAGFVIVILKSLQGG